MQQRTDHAIGGQVVSASPICDCALRAAKYVRTAGVRWPATNPSELLQFWRLFRRLELRRGHGRLRIDGKSYWK